MQRVQLRKEIPVSPASSTATDMMPLVRAVAAGVAAEVFLETIGLERGKRRWIPLDREQALPPGQVQPRAQAATACE